MIVKQFLLDKSKVKRIFAFGCSFTNFIWPTWADLLSKEMPDAEFYNFGKSGIGNLAISSKISEAAVKFNFTSSDLVLVMWSTFLREDRWVQGTWVGAGNVYHNDIYDKNFLQKHVDVCGYFIRDLSLINLTKTFLDNLDCQAVLMPSVPIDYLEHTWLEFHQETQQEVIDTYRFLFKDMPISLFEFASVNNLWPVTHAYYWSEQHTKHNDSHPSPLVYYNYLDHNVIKLSETTKTYATEVTNKLFKLEYKTDIIKEFEYDTKSHRLF